ncbi:MAG: hypothetical protein POH28_05220, partial [Acidocella sp.]|nr:hypothetical protein [Acidocella sp.]
HASHLVAGDYLAVPHWPVVEIPKNLSLKLLRTDTANLGAFDPFCTSRPALFYSSNATHGPWSLSSGCTQRIDIFEVK